MSDLSDRELLERLIAFDSTSRNSNLPIAEFIADYVDGPDVEIELDKTADGQKANVIVQTRARDGGSVPPGSRVPGLVLSGHLDVVPAEEPGWISDPFRLSEREGNLFGRGACDMKGFVALAVNAFRAVVARSPRAPLVLLLTRDEEVGTMGAQDWAQSWDGPPLPTDVVVGEPTNLQVVTMHKGFVQLRLDFTGIAAHSGYPHLGRNAIEPAAEAVTALTSLRRDLDAERPPYSEHFPDVPFAALNTGRISGGSAINVVPDHCSIDVGIRLLPTMSGETMVERVRAAVAAAVGDTPFTIEVLSDSPPMWLDTPTDVATNLLDAVGQAAPATVSYATDAGWFQTVGHRCVIFGPGSIEVAHKPNEYLAIDQFDRARSIVTALLERHLSST